MGTTHAPALVLRQQTESHTVSCLSRFQILAVEIDEHVGPWGICHQNPTPFPDALPAPTSGGNAVKDKLQPSPSLGPVPLDPIEDRGAVVCTAFRADVRRNRSGRRQSPDPARFPSPRLLPNRRAVRTTKRRHGPAGGHSPRRTSHPDPSPVRSTFARDSRVLSRTHSLCVVMTMRTPVLTSRASSRVNSACIPGCRCASGSSMMSSSPGRTK